MAKLKKFFYFLKQAQSLKMKVLKGQRFFIHRKARGVTEEAQSQKMKVLKRQRFFIIGRLKEFFHF